ncbi:hypothetical protein O181_006145 [Austropuccinia psidii MF-1]|uniref:FAR1 domain-containing protein n=1 Tax=Austropuccinia psidii MF-1 TaxID=1389203 RepID=A0A9Q3BJT1_9BASI|nr:hypothetical protein [Austropuccinia psidii MF-1]
MTHNQIKIGRDRAWTPNSHKSTYKTVTSRNIDCPFRLYARKYPKNTTWNLTVKNPEHSHDATKNIMEHPAFRKFNEKETSKVAQISESLLIQRQIKAQSYRQRENERNVTLQDIYNQVKIIMKENYKA